MVRVKVYLVEYVEDLDRYAMEYAQKKRKENEGREEMRRCRDAKAKGGIYTQRESGTFTI